MPRPQSASSGPTLRKSQRPCGRLQNCLARRLLAGGCPALGWWWRVSQNSYIPSQQSEIAKKGEKTGGFTHVLSYKSPKTPFFALKYLTRYTHEAFFKEYINIKIFRNLSHCGSYTCSKFRKSYTPPAARIRVNVLLGNLPLKKVQVQCDLLCESQGKRLQILYLYN